MAATSPGAGPRDPLERAVNHSVRCEPENNSPFVQYMNRRLWM